MSRIVVPAGAVDSLTWAPDGRRIAFTSGALFVVGVDGHGLRRLTARAQEVDWQP
jgi:hypothetical protein